MKGIVLWALGVPVIVIVALVGGALLASGLASSKADARRGIEGRGFYLNGQAIERADATLRSDDLHGPAEEPFVILRKGKKNYVRLVLSP